MNISQDSEGFASPLLRNLRISAIVPLIAPHEIVLDLGCGAGYLADFLPKGVHYYGVDKLPFWQEHARKNEDTYQQFFAVDLEVPSSFEKIRNQFGVKADVIVLAAFLEHIPNPDIFLSNIVPLLKPNGRFIGTTPHPIGRKIHDTLSKFGVTSRSAAEEHHKFLDKKELTLLSNALGGRLTFYKRLLFGLNQLFVISLSSSE